MSAHTTDPDDSYGRPTAGPDASQYDRYGRVETANGELIVYDRDDEEGWIQSDVAADLEEFR